MGRFWLTPAFTSRRGSPLSTCLFLRTRAQANARAIVSDSLARRNAEVDAANAPSAIPATEPARTRLSPRTMKPQPWPWSRKPARPADLRRGLSGERDSR
jgi:hypothetical protein